MWGVISLTAASFSTITLGAKPIGEPASWISMDDYPDEAIRAEKSGMVELDISIDEQGRAARCRIIISSGTDILDKTGCAALMKRGRREPTLDDSGRPTFATYRRRIRWTIPGTTPPASPSRPDMEIEVAKLPVPLAEAVVVIRQIQRVDGSQESCSIVQPSTSAALNRAACRVAGPLTALDPIGNAAGERVRGVRWRRIQFVGRADPAAH